MRQPPHNPFKSIKKFYIGDKDTRIQFKYTNMASNIKYFSTIFEFNPNLDDWDYYRQTEYKICC